MCEAEQAIHRFDLPDLKAAVEQVNSLGVPACREGDHKAYHPHARLKEAKG